MRSRPMQRRTTGKLRPQNTLRYSLGKVVKATRGNDRDMLRRRGGGARAPDVVQDQALAVVKRHAHVPLLPHNAAAVDREAGPLGLHDVQRLQPCARRRRFTQWPQAIDKSPPSATATPAVGLVGSQAAAALRVARSLPPYGQSHVNTAWP